MTTFLRDIDPVLLAAMQKPIIYPVVLADVEWGADTLYLHSGQGDLPWQGRIYLGAGRIARVDAPEEAEGIAPQEAFISLLGDKADVIADAKVDSNGGRVDLYFGLTTAPGVPDLIGTPYRYFTGTFDGKTFELDVEGGGAKLDHRLGTGVGARSAMKSRHSDADQQAQHPGDTLFARCGVGARWRDNPPTWPAN